MNAFRAVKADFLTETPPLRTRSRSTAISSALEDDEQVALHEQVVDPLVYRAASELIRLDDEGHKTDIEAQGQVYDVLQSIESELVEIGASRFAMTQILDTLKTYVSGLGADFARQAKAKPLYARVMVTDKEPEDIPDCKLSAVTCIDGSRIQGDDAGKMSMTLTLYGTSNAMSSGMSMERIFESGKKKWLMVYYGTIEGADLNKFDTVDADLATLIQAVGAGGGASIEEIRAAIEQGTLPPEIKALIAKVAELNGMVEAARTPGAVENPELKIAELKAAIIELSQNIPDIQALPPVLLQAVAQSIESADAAFAKPEAPIAEAPSNDNDTLSEQTNSVLEQVTALLENDALPPEVKEKLTALLEDIAASLPEKKFTQLETAMGGIKETLMEFAASDAAGPQIFRTISEILPSVVVAEKQIGEVAARPPTAEAPAQEEAAAAIPPELAETVAALQVLTSDKIDIILKDEHIAPEVRENLREMVKTIEAAIDQKDFSKLALVTTDMRQALTDLAISEILPSQVSRSIFESLPVLSAASQNFAEVLPRIQAERILEAITLTDQKLQSGEIKIDASNPQIAVLINEIKETIKTGGPDAAIQKIIETLKTPSVDGAANPIIEVLAKQPFLLQSLPPEIKNTILEAIPASDTVLRQQLSAVGVERSEPVRTPTVLEALTNAEVKIRIEAQTDPAKADVVKALSEIKALAKKDPQAAAEKIAQIVGTPTADGKPNPIAEAIGKQPELVRAVVDAAPAMDMLLRQQLSAVGVERSEPVRTPTVLEALTNAEAKIRIEAQTDPVKADVVKALSEIKVLAEKDPQAAAEKIAQIVATPTVDGKPNPMAEAIGRQSELIRAIVISIPATDANIYARSQLELLAGAATQPPSVQTLQNAVDATIRKMGQEGGNAIKPETAKVFLDIKEALKSGNPDHAIKAVMVKIEKANPEMVKVFVREVMAQPLPSNVKYALVAPLIQTKSGMASGPSSPVMKTGRENRVFVRPAGAVSALSTIVKSPVKTVAVVASRQVTKLLTSVSKITNSNKGPARISGGQQGSTDPRSKAVSVVAAVASRVTKNNFVFSSFVKPKVSLPEPGQKVKDNSGLLRVFKGREPITPPKSQNNVATIKFVARDEAAFKDALKSLRGIPEIRKLDVKELTQEKLESIMSKLDDRQKADFKAVIDRHTNPVFEPARPPERERGLKPDEGRIPSHGPGPGPVVDNPPPPKPIKGCPRICGECGACFNGVAKDEATEAAIRTGVANAKNKAFGNLEAHLGIK